ncbi:uncharacterized protein LAESUDRAFT_495611 [Laetiporus sulphureus 93-53]|uniref:Uncharacterized protein n=1 Tax=Laetiporus sulphureus 93-53 TaxID=1314785 RepID=A0A165BIA1_9APHY|nr:uncharacterized protein LAESUDRAFT_495611 [Laetiporus sulphureus 93-53]KZT01109.1 hypothetical protein LAESUDRAFT_495611 [Laetiporus sulphureus 93-53]
MVLRNATNHFLLPVGASPDDAYAVGTEEKLASAARDSVLGIATSQLSTDTTLLAQQRGSESESTRSTTADSGMEHTGECQSRCHIFCLRLLPQPMRSRAGIASAASTDLRAILLSKLAREKRITSIPTASHDNPSQPCNGRSPSVEKASDVLEPGDGDVARHVRSDAAGPQGSSTEIDDAEARLRRRAQLRVRFAAQKKMASISGDLPDEKGIHHTDHSSEAHGGIGERLAMAKEDLLRRRLQERREGSHP